MNAEYIRGEVWEDERVLAVGRTVFSDDRQKERCVLIAEAMIAESATVRRIAGEFGISKSTVHKDLTERLVRVHPGLYAEVRELLLRNKAERHLRGGEATRRKYMKKKAK